MRDAKRQADFTEYGVFMPFPYRGESKKLDDDARGSASGTFIQLSKGLTH